LGGGFGSPCEWTGVSCADGRIRALNLRGPPPPRHLHLHHRHLLSGRKLRTSPAMKAVREEEELPASEVEERTHRAKEERRRRGGVAARERGGEERTTARR